MSRILSKGSELEFADQNRDWNETSNIKDFDIVFFNLKSLEERKDKFLQVEPFKENKIEFPSQEDVLKLIRSGGDLICILPTTRKIIAMNRDVIPKKITQDLFEWLPAELHFNEEKGESLEEGSVNESWKWYFNEQFEWPMCFTPTKNIKTSYLDLTETGCTQSGIYAYVETLALNGYYENIAIKILFSKSYPGKITSESDLFEGSIYLLPLKKGENFNEFTKKVLEKNYPDFEESAGEVPEWLENYTIPEEKKTLEKIKKLENRLQGMKKYKKLLYERGNALGKIVRKTFRDVGLDVEGEVPGRRDGAINFEDLRIIMEITGTSGNISMEKCRQLNHWVDNSRAEDPDKNTTGLLVANIQCNTDPKERDFEIPSNIKNYLKQYDYKYITTLELFKMMKKWRGEEISVENIEEKIKEGGTVITFGNVSLKDEKTGE